jgi:hypothetical protein
MRRHFLAVLSAAIVSDGGCDKATEPVPVISGSWSGSGGGVNVALSLTQSSQSVSGNGSMSGPSGAAALSVTGSFTNPNFSLTVSSPGDVNFNSAGTLSENSMTGVVSGSGFNHVGMPCPATDRDAERFHDEKATEAWHEREREGCRRA